MQADDSDVGAVFSAMDSALDGGGLSNTQLLGFSAALSQVTAGNVDVNKLVSE